jgi:hypothetical protein
MLSLYHLLLPVEAPRECCDFQPKGKLPQPLAYPHQGHPILAGVKLLKTHSTCVCLSFAKARFCIQTRDLVFQPYQDGGNPGCEE